MRGNNLKPIRKKACPYCGKKLQAKIKRQWRNNLSRHLGRGVCLPYEAERPMREAYMWAFITRFFEMLGLTGKLLKIADTSARTIKELQEIEEFKRLYHQS